MRALGVDAGRARRGFPGGPRARGRAGGRAATAHGAVVPSRPGARCGELLAGILRELARTRRPTWCTCRSAWGRGSPPRQPRGPMPASPPQLVGVVSAHATSYLDSFRAGRVVEAPVTTVLADGMACRTPRKRRWRWCGARPTTWSRSATTKCAGHARAVLGHPQRRRRGRRRGACRRACSSANASRAGRRAWC